MEKAPSERTRSRKKNGQTGRSPDIVQKMLGVCEAKNGTKADELLDAGTDVHQRIWQNGERKLNTRGRESPSKRAKELDNRGRKEKNHEEGVSEAVINNFEMEGFHGAKRPVEDGEGENNEGTRRVAK